MSSIQANRCKLFRQRSLNFVVFSSEKSRICISLTPSSQLWEFYVCNTKLNRVWYEDTPVLLRMSRDTIKARKLLLELEKRKSESVEVMIYMSHPFLFNERFTDYKEKKKTKMCEWRGSSSFVNAFSFPLFWSLQGNEFDWNADAQCIIYETQKKLSIFT